MSLLKKKKKNKQTVETVEFERFCCCCFHEMTSSTFPRLGETENNLGGKLLMTVETAQRHLLLASKRHLNARKREGSN